MENKIKDLINELRLRISQLKEWSDEEFLIGVINLFNWMLKIKEFQSVFDELEKLNVRESSILNEVGEKLYIEIKKAWETLKNYVKPDLFLELEEEQKNLVLFETEDKNGKHVVLKLQEMIEGKKTYYIIDIYHALRYLIEQIYHHSSYRSRILKKNFIIFNKEGKIVEFVPINVFEQYKLFIKINTKLKEQNKYIPLETYNYLKQLLILYQEEDWKWQLNKWREVFGKEFYIPRLNTLSNFFYDFLVLKIEEKIDWSKLEKFKIEGLEFNLKKKNNRYILTVGKNGEYGSIEFNPSKSNFGDKNIALNILRFLVKNKDRKVSFKDLKNNIKGLQIKDIYTYISYFNGRFKNSIDKGFLKIYLVVRKEKNKSMFDNELRLLAFPFSKVFIHQNY